MYSFLSVTDVRLTRHISWIPIQNKTT